MTSVQAIVYEDAKEHPKGSVQATDLDKQDSSEHCTSEQGASDPSTRKWNNSRTGTNSRPQSRNFTKRVYLHRVRLGLHCVENIKLHGS